MPDNSGLQRSNTERANDAKEKAMKAITILQSEHVQVNFSTVALRSGVSRQFLYGNSELRAIIEEQRKCDVNNEINRRARFDKTSKSKDVIIAAKDKRIAKLEAENKRLKDELSILRGMIYVTK